MITAAAGFLLASPHQVFWALLIETLVGMSLVMASACVFNNYIDKDIDKKMSRTQNRATATGTISGFAAIIYALLLGALGFIVLGIFTNWLVFGLGAIAIFSYVVLYGLAKRATVHGTLIGSIPGATPPAAGYLAVTNHIDAGAILLFLTLVCWQMPHFYAISMYRYKDYKTAGLPVLAVKKGMLAARRQIIAYVFIFTIVAALLSTCGYAGIFYRVIVILLGAYWLYTGIQGWDLADKAWGKRMFLASLKVMMFWSVMVAFGSRLP